MPPSESAVSASPSLEQILWRSMDRFAEEPALLDAEEFAAQIGDVFEGEVPAEAWVERFFAGHPDDALHQSARKGPRDVAEAIVRSRKQRLAVYEFNLDRLEYVLIEDKKKVVVVSDFGQFALQNDDQVSRAIESAVLPRSGPALDRRGDQPRAFFVRGSGEVVAVDVKKIAAALHQLMGKQVSMPTVDRPAARLLPFAPTRRALTEPREERALRQDARARLPMPPPRLAPGSPAAKAPAGAETTLLVVLPDGALARPSIGSATRFQDMLSTRSARGEAVRADGGQRFVLQAGQIVAVFSGGEKHLPGSAGDKALAQGEGVAAARGGGAPIRILGDDDLAKALIRGAMVVPGFQQSDRFWVQPEGAFVPAEKAAPPAGRGSPAMVALQLGQITGDPWSDWALMGGGAALKAAVGRAPPPLQKGGELALSGAPVVAFRAPDGSILLQRANGAIRLAATDRPQGGSRGGPLAERAGAIPATALAALHTALERTAMAGGFRLPLVKIESAPDAIERGRGLTGDGFARLAGTGSMRATTAQLVLSMPFPNQGELHVGKDLEAALHSYLGGSVAPAPDLVLKVRNVDAPREQSALHRRALGSAREAFLTLDLDQVRPLIGTQATLSGLPGLLARAVEQGGTWQPGPGAPMPLAVRQMALGNFAAGPELAVASAAPPPRALRPGEDEIVIPLPLWSQMGRGFVSETDQIMAAPLSPRAFAPPLGIYQLVAPAGAPLDFTSSTAPAVQLRGPSLLDLGARAGQISAQVRGGSFTLGNVALDAPRRMRIGAPLDPAALRQMREAASVDLPRIEASQPAAIPGPVPMIPVLGPLPRLPDAASGAMRPGLADSPLPRAGTTGFAPSAASSGANVTLPSIPRAVAGSSSGLDLARSVEDVRAQVGASVRGLAPGMWSGHRPADAGYQRWSYSRGAADRTVSPGGVDLSGLSRPAYPSIPASLRFRYAGAPLWWSRSTRSIGRGEAASSDDTPASGALRTGLRAANSAAALWRSIFTAGGHAADLSGGMDADRDGSADEMAVLGRKLDALAGAAIVSGGAQSVSARGAETVYVAMSGSGRAGTMTASAAHKARAQALELSIVAAIPPSPPPLETMGAGPTLGEAPRARASGAQTAHGHPKEHEDAVSHSKIEGSVDAIAQRIYHRIRRRIESDRERFGG